MPYSVPPSHLGGPDQVWVPGQSGLRAAPLRRFGLRPCDSAVSNSQVLELNVREAEVLVAASGLPHGTEGESVGREQSRVDC